MGRTQVGTKICWAESEAAAADIAYQRWGHEPFGGQLSQDLPMWQGFEALREQVTPAKVAESVPCGPDPERAAAHLQQLIDARFDEVYVSQMGPISRAASLSWRSRCYRC